MKEQPDLVVDLERPIMGAAAPTLGTLVIAVTREDEPTLTSFYRRADRQRGRLLGDSADPDTCPRTV